MNPLCDLRNLRLGLLAAVLGPWSISPMLVAQTTTEGSVKLTATINDLGAKSATLHFALVWVTKEDNTFITTLWKQANGFTSSHLTGHCATWNLARGTSTDVAADGYTSATAADYSTTIPALPARANNPISLTWNCKYPNGTTVPDGKYIFKIQYAEDTTPKDGPVSDSTLMTWTKDSSAHTLNPVSHGALFTPTGGANFSGISIVWTPAPATPPTITSGVPTATGSQGTSYNYTCTATGTAPVSFSATNLPTGLSISAAGVISGKPTVAGVFSGTITASNSALPNATQSFTITIAQAIVFTSAAPAGTGNVGTSYNHTCTVIGTAPVTFTATGLPTSLVMSSAGVISGTPSATGTFNGTVTASNGGLATPVNQSFSIVISPAVVYTAGTVTLSAVIHDLVDATDTRHFAVVWVTKTVGATNQFIKTLWKQGDGTDFSDPSGGWAEHFLAWNAARGASTALDGYSSATAEDYSTSVPALPAKANNPIAVSWNCHDANDALLADGSYKFWIQYAEDIGGVVNGPATTGLAWTKGTASDAQNPLAQGSTDAPVGGSNFTDMHIVWTPTPATYLVTFDPQSGVVPTPAALTVTAGSTYGTLATTSRTGYTFGGWWTVAGGTGTQITAATTVTITGAQTLYAKWTAVNTPLQDWRLTNFGNSNNSGTGADTYDFDKDGIPNLIEFALGLNPKTNSAGMWPRPQKSGSNYVISFTQPAGVSGITYGAEWSETLASGNWTGVADTGSAPQHTFSVPIGTKTKLFMRLKVINPNP